VDYSEAWLTNSVIQRERYQLGAEDLEPKFTTGDIGTDRETLSMVRNIGNPGFPKAIYKQRETYQGGKLGTLEYCTTSNVRRETFGGRFWERWPTTADLQTGNAN
jgi:hypothetical protein